MSTYRVLYSFRLDQYMVQKLRTFLWLKWWKTEEEMECGWDSVYYHTRLFSTEKDARKWIKEQAPINWRYIPPEEVIPDKPLPITE